MRKLVCVGLAIWMVLLAACAGDSGQEVSPQPTQPAQTQPMTQLLQAKMLVIGEDDSGLAAAVGAVEEGAESVIVLGHGLTPTDAALKSQAEDSAAITMLDADAGSLLLDSATGAIVSVRATQGEQVWMIDSPVVVLAIDPAAEGNAPLLSFLSRDEEGELLVDEAGQVRRDANAVQGPPTKCGVPLTSGDEGGEAGPQIVSVRGLYAQKAALAADIYSSARELGAALIAAAG